MGQSHYWPEPLPRYGKGTEIHLAIRTPDTLFVFLHGFRGHAVNTWVEFPKLLLEEPKFARCDLLFYGYGMSDIASPQAGGGIVFQFLDQVIDKRAAAIVNASLPQAAPPRSPSFNYKRIVIVAHSLGAVLARQALLQAVRQKVPWVDKIRLVLFSPAHKGSDIVRMASDILGVIKPLTPAAVKSLLLLRWPVLRSIEYGAGYLTSLEADTLAELKSSRKRRHPLKASLVVIAAKDWVVDNSKFANDPDPQVIEGRHHSDVCKPSARFWEPIRLLLEAL